MSTIFKKLSQEQWVNTVKGFSIIDCAFYDSDKILLVAKENIDDDEYDIFKEGELEARGIPIIFSGNETKCGTYSFGGLRFPTVSTSEEPEHRGIFSSRQQDGLVFLVGEGGVKEREIISPNAKENPNESAFVLRLKTIDGIAYATSFGRTIHKRVAPNQWETVHEGLTWPEHMDTTDMGFEDIHGPDESNMYAVGGCGDVWHYDGKNGSGATFLAMSSYPPWLWRPMAMFISVVKAAVYGAASCTHGRSYTPAARACSIKTSSGTRINYG